jgi:DNA repair photolyase
MRERSFPSRGAGVDPGNRFTGREIVLDGDELDRDAMLGEVVGARTRVFRDTSRSVITSNTSPDIPFDRSLNPYRGCEHGCSYCYARPTHEYLGLSAGLDFERLLFAKLDAPELLARELAKPSWTPEQLALSGVTDPYQPIERRLRITRGCLEVLAAYRQPVGLITKNALLERDVDLLQELATYGAVRVALSITTLDDELGRRLEPRASTAAGRLQALRTLADAGVPVSVMVAPVIPGLNDHEIPAILAAAAAAGAQHAGWQLLRLPRSVEPIFVAWLSEQLPERTDRILALLRGARGGALSDGRFGHRMRGEGAYARQLGSLFEVHRRRAGLSGTSAALDGSHFRVPGRSVQPRLFGAGDRGPSP